MHVFKVESHVEGDWRITRARILLASWGLAVDLTARLRVVQIERGWSDTLILLRPQLALDVTGVVLSDPDIEALTEGLEIMADRFPVAAGPQASVVEVRALAMTLPDYQPDVAMVAMANWAAAYLGVPAPMFKVTFDTPSNRYVVAR